jgi:hypothetical protein
MSKFIKEYRELGWHLLRIRKNSKEPMDKGWQNAPYTGPWSPEWNVGVALGKKSRNLVDLDLDWPEAREIASIVFKLEGIATFGRKSCPLSHVLVSSEIENIKKYTLPKSFAEYGPEKHTLCVLEVRGNGYTVLPPSIHPSGETIEWYCDGTIPKVEAKTLFRQIGPLAFISVCIRFWPEEGGRHDAAFAFANICKWAGISETICLNIIEYVSHDDREKKDRLRTVTDAYKHEGECAKWEKFFEAFSMPHDAQRTFNKWLGLSSNKKEYDFGRFEDKYCIILDGSKVRIGLEKTDEYGRRTWRLLTRSDFLLLERSNLAKIWLGSESCPTYDGFTFSVHGGRIVNNKINLWRGWNITPQKGDYSLIKRHILEVLAGGNEEYAEYIIKWAAWAYQNPDKQAEVALVFRGGKGTGKSIFAKAFIKSAGQHGMHVSSSNLITGRFNAHLRDCVFFFADEAFWAGDKAAEGMLKALITERTIAVEAKYKDPKEIHNRLHIIIASNEDWVIPATGDERRFAVFDVSDKHKQDHNYFKKLADQIENDGWAAFMDYLMKLDLKGWHPRQNVPQTEALQSQIKLSESPVRRHLRDHLERGVLPGTFHTTNPELSRLPNEMFVSEFEETLKKKAYGHNVSTTKIGIELGKLTGVTKTYGKKLKYIDEYRSPVYQDRAVIYVFPSLPEARKNFDPHADWDEKTEWAFDQETIRNDDNVPF